jgi:uncharacterized membrane protein
MAGQAGPEVTSDDKLWALLTYIFTPLVPIIVLLMEDKKNRPFIKAHNMQALVLGIANLVIGGLLSFTVILACVPIIVWIYCLYLGFQAYGGKYVEIPIITKLCKDQGWA